MTGSRRHVSEASGETCTSFGGAEDEEVPSDGAALSAVLLPPLCRPRPPVSDAAMGRGGWGW